MIPKRVTFCFLLLILFMTGGPVWAAAPTSTAEAVDRIADRLALEQIPTGPDTGAWPEQDSVYTGEFVGVMVAGLVDAYQLRCNPVYLTAAEAGGQWIKDQIPSCALYYHEAYGLMRLSQAVCVDEQSDWLVPLTDFYTCVQAQGDELITGTQWFIDDLVTHTQTVPATGLTDFSVVTFQVAYYTVAAWYVDDPEKHIWRDNLIELLEQLDNTQAFPVRALGAATWALAQAGGLDGTVVTVGDPAWGGYPGGVATTLDELADLLESYRVTGVSPPKWNDHVYWRLVPQADNDTGYTQENVFGILGLDEADENDPAATFRDAIDAVWAKNLAAVDDDGNVSWNAANPGSEGDVSYYFYAGEYLQALAAAQLPGDLNLDDAVDLADLAELGSQWLSSLGCDQCSKADLNRDRNVNLTDLARLAQGWGLWR